MIIIVAQTISFTSLAPRRCGCEVKCTIFTHILSDGHFQHFLWNCPVMKAAWPPWRDVNDGLASPSWYSWVSCREHIDGLAQDSSNSIAKALFVRVITVLHKVIHIFSIQYFAIGKIDQTTRDHSGSWVNCPPYSENGKVGYFL